MLTSRLLLALLLLTTLATLPSPSDGTFFGGGSLGAYLLPAALIGLPLPLGPLALGIGLAGIKVAIFTRVLSFLAGVLGSRGDGKRGITVRKEFVHVPAKNIHRAIRPLVGPPPWPRTLEHPPLLGPQSYGFPGGIPPTAFAETVFSPFEVKRATMPTQFLSPDKILQGAQPATGGTFDQLLHIAQSPAVSNIVSNNPDLVVKFLRGIVGAKPLQTPIGTAHSTAGLTGSKIGGGDIEALLNFVREDPNLVRNIVRADPQFVPSLVNNILGIPGEGGRQPTPAPPANFSGFDFNQSSNRHRRRRQSGQSYCSLTDPVQKDKPKTTSTTAFTTPRPPKAALRPGIHTCAGVITPKRTTPSYETPSRTSRPGPSYTPSSTGQAGTLTKSIVVTAEKPVVEQDLPVPMGTEGDIYFSGVQDEQISPFGSDRPTPKKTAGPPPVRPVFVPATGNAASSHISGSAKPRARRDTSSASAMTDLMNLFNPRTMDNRKCVFKMVCFIGANDHTLGRTKFGDSIARVLRYIALYTLRYVIRYIKRYMDDTVLNGGDDLAAAYNAAYEVGRTHGGEGCRIKYNSCPMTVVDLVSLSANFG
ncbi:hypothetical protein MRX96_025135 [Rhipicephalus microplus]